MALPPSAFVAEVHKDLRASEYCLPEHPIIVSLEAGTLDIPAMRRWAVQNFLFIKDHARVFGLVYGHCPDSIVRPHILRVLVEETLGIYSNSGPHIDHLERFCVALGVVDPHQSDASPATVAAIEWWLRLADEGSWLEGWGTWAFSNRRPAFARVYEALRARYSFDEDELLFWKIHSTPAATDEVRQQELEAVYPYLESDDAQRSVRASALTLAGHWMSFWTARS